MSKLKAREEFEGGLEKGKGKGGKRRKRMIKHTLKYLNEALMNAKKPHKNRGKFFWLARIYTPANMCTQQALSGPTSAGPSSI